MKIVLLGGAGFIGTNLAITLAQKKHSVIMVDWRASFFQREYIKKYPNIKCVTCDFSVDMKLDDIVKGADVLFHLVSTSYPSNTNRSIPDEIEKNVIFTGNLLEACVSGGVGKIVFISSGGTVYGKDCSCPCNEDDPLNPITAYGLQKMTIEKMLYLYNYIHNQNYVIARLSNPYGPFQRPNGKLGFIATCLFRMIKGEKVVIYGDGSVIRDYIYISDAVKALINLMINDTDHRIYNLGSGKGRTILEIVNAIEETFDTKLTLEFQSNRVVDVPRNYLRIDRYESEFGKIIHTSLDEGLLKTYEYLKNL